MFFNSCGKFSVNQSMEVTSRRWMKKSREVTYRRWMTKSREVTSRRWMTKSREVTSRRWMTKVGRSLPGGGWHTAAGCHIFISDIWKDFQIKIQNLIIFLFGYSRFVSTPWLNKKSNACLGNSTQYWPAQVQIGCKVKLGCSFVCY